MYHPCLLVNMVLVIRIELLLYRRDKRIHLRSSHTRIHRSFRPGNCEVNTPRTVNQTRQQVRTCTSTHPVHPSGSLSSVYGCHFVLSIGSGYAGYCDQMAGFRRRKWYVVNDCRMISVSEFPVSYEHSEQTTFPERPHGKSLNGNRYSTRK